MPHNYVLTPLAQSDLENIRLYISQDNPAAAKRLIKDIASAIASLAENPDIGHTREDLTDKPVKFLSVKHYMIIYRPDKTPLQILRVLSGYRDITSIL